MTGWPGPSRRMLIALVPVFVVAGVATLGRDRAPEMAAWTVARLEAVQRGLGLVVEGVEITGRRLTPADAVAEALGPVEGRLLGALDLAAVRARLEAISWVATAEVLRAWPDRILVHLSEREPFALWQHEGALALVDARGVVLTRDGLARWRHLPLLAGSGAPESAPALLALLEETPKLARRVSAALRVGTRRWDIEMDNGIRIKLPAAENGSEAQGYGPEEAWHRFAALEKRHRLLARAVAVIDLRLSDRLTVRLSPQGRALGLAEGRGASI